MRLKWHFRNESTPEFSDQPAFSPKSSWNPPTGHPNLEVFLSQVEHELFQIRKNGRLLDHWQRIDLLSLKRQTKVHV